MRRPPRNPKESIFAKGVKLSSVNTKSAALRATSVPFFPIAIPISAAFREGDKNDTSYLMRRPPRNPKESIFAKGGLFLTLFYGMVIAGITLLAFFTIPYGYLRIR